MKTLTNVTELSSGPKALCIGNFDGVHRGHQSLIKQVCELSGVEKVALSFRPHPVEVLAPQKKLLKVQQWHEMPVLLGEYGVEVLVLQEFSKSFLELKPEEFILDWLVPHLYPQVIVVGEGFSFGCGQKGDVDFLKSYEAKCSFKVVAVPPVVFQGKRVSSTLVRELLSKGELGEVRALLGRFYFLEGSCEKGEGRGREIGFPTINIPLEENLAIRTGVYICNLLQGEKRYPAVANIGVAPTFHKERKKVLEVHVLDFVPLWGKVRVEFIKFLRGEKKFPSKEALIHQIAKDVEEARDFFSL